MKRAILLLLLLLIMIGCNKVDTPKQPQHPGDELVGSWIGKGTYYAGSEIMGSTTFVFNNDKTFVAMDKAKGMPTLTERGEWFVNGDTLKMKFKKNKEVRANIIAFEERNGGPKDIIKPILDDSSSTVAWNYKVSGNKLHLEINGSFNITNELVRE